MKQEPFHLLGILFCLILTLTSGCQQEEPVVREFVKPIRIFTLGDTLLNGGKEFIGRAEASQSADLSFRVSGRLIELPVRQGEQVPEGHIVARLDTRDYETRIAEVQSQLDQAQAVLAQMRSGARPEDIRRLEAALNARQSEVDGAQAEFERYEILLKDGVVSRQEYDQVKTRLDGARATLENARQDLAIGQRGARDEEIAAQQAQIRSLDARLKETRDNLSDTVLKAPFAGAIARIDTRAFEEIQANQPVMSLQDTDPMDIVISITEQDMAQGRGSGNPIEDGSIVARVQFPALSEEWYPVRVKELQTEADPQTQTFKVVLQMDQPAGLPVQPGMNAVVRSIEDQGSGQATYIPLGALFSDPAQGDCVWLINPETMRVVARSVTLGDIVDDQVEVTEGLAPGDQIAASAVNLLRDGMQVEAMRKLGSL